MFYSLTENGVDGETFLLLTEADLAEMVKAVGIRRKLIVKQATLKNGDSIVVIFFLFLLSCMCP